MTVRDTSLETYHKIEESGLLSQRRFEVYSGLFKHGPATASELHQKAIKSMTKNNLSGRLTELRNAGIVDEIGTKICEVTGHTVIVWDVNNKIPKALKKDKLSEFRKKERSLMQALSKVRVSIANELKKRMLANQTNLFGKNK